ncbi:M23 family metallopeptidase [Propionibacteriaceae bacterium G57]|uniref:M23 family metallopeptidase n=1 Tax=Aestuariimicrobium sp. G57 TaxID=3418485 RepID=UPI003DA79103
MTPLPRRPLLICLLTGLLVLVTLVAPAGQVPRAAATDRIPGLVLQQPVPGVLQRGFSAPLERWGAGHRGVDLAAAVGDPVRAGADGTISFAGRVAGRGVVTIDHGDGVSTTHEPVEAAVSRGDRVVTGQVIGRIGTGSHGRALHWGLRWSGTYHDPMLYLLGQGQSSPGPVRLLPTDAQPRPLAVVAGPLGGGIPVTGPVTSPFGMRRHPVLGVWKLHDGVDYGAPCGAPIRSVGSGRVVLVERHAAYGNRVVIDIGGGRRHGYAHLGSIGVRLGDQVPAGGYVGAVGSTGYSTGCHLHFMAWQHGVVVPPV